MTNDKMKRKLFVFGFIIFTISSCQFVPIILPTPTISDTVATQTPFPLMLQPGSPAYIQNFAHMDASCNWLGIAGQIFDASGKTINNLVVNVKGNLGQAAIDEIGLTGIPEADIYGHGGYEIKIADRAVDSENSLVVQVFDIQGNSLSNAIPFKTYSACEKNLIIVNLLMK